MRLFGRGGSATDASVTDEGRHVAEPNQETLEAERRAQSGRDGASVTGDRSGTGETSVLPAVDQNHAGHQNHAGNQLRPSAQMQSGSQWQEPTGPLAAQAVNVYKIYGSGDNQVNALNGVTVGFEKGRFTAIMGPSGSGKSTLMHCLAGLDAVSSGNIRIGDTDLSSLGDKGLTALRRDKLGFVFQSFNLVPTLTAQENITLPLDIAGRKPDAEWMGRVVDTLKLRDRLNHRPSEMSGGQQQRVACARAIVGQPEVIFGDEPTGNLDSRTSGEVLAILRDSVDNLGQTVVIVTHDPRAAAWADRVIFLADGQLAGQMYNPTAEAVLDAMKDMEA